jgi:hypothetical protein
MGMIEKFTAPQYHTTKLVSRKYASKRHYIFLFSFPLRKQKNKGWGLY